MERLCIYPKDIQIVTGKSERYGRYLICLIRKKFAKEPHELVSVEEFCLYTGLNEAKVIKSIRA